MFQVLVILCSVLVPEPDCVLDRSLQHQWLGQAPTEIACFMAGMTWAVANWEIQEDQQLKVSCVRTDMLPGTRT